MLPKPWYRKDKTAWYLQVNRHEQKRLGKTKAEADEAYRRWILEQGEALPQAERKNLTVAELAQAFLDSAKLHTKPKSYEFYCYIIVPFVERFGSAPAATFPPLSFTRWLDDHEGWKGSRRCCTVAVKRLFNWAVEHKLLSENPLRSVKRRPRKRRNRVLTPEERGFIFAKIPDEQFREFVFAMLDTGCRPGEIMSVSAANVSRDFSMWVFDEHKTEHTGQARVVYLTPEICELTRKLVAVYLEGPLLRSTRKFEGVRRPWTRNGIRCRFKRLREKFQKLREALPPERRGEIPDLAGVTAYVLRHTFATQALSNGLSTPVVASLLGHRLTKMLEDHYNHLDQAAELLKDAARRATAK
jgi:integrase